MPLVCDMSSDILSRPVDVSKYDLIYAGAQKNLGPSGATVVIVKNAALGQVNRPIPTMLNYQTISITTPCSTRRPRCPFSAVCKPCAG